MKATQAVLVALVATIILASVAAAGPEAAKQRVAIDMKLWPQKTFVLTPMQAGALKPDSGTISHNWLSIPGRDVMRDGQKVDDLRRRCGDTHRKARNAHDSRPERVGRFRARREWRRSERRHRHRDLEGRARDRPVRRDRREGAKWPDRPR